MKNIIIIFLLIMSITLSFSRTTLIWPLGPGNEIQEVMNNYYQFRNYHEHSYHDGLDIKADRYDPVHSVSDGYIAEIYDGGEGYSGIFIVDSTDFDEKPGWTYFHVVPLAELEVGQFVHQGDLIGHIDNFPVSGDIDFNHLHLERIKYLAEFGLYDTSPDMGGRYVTFGNPMNFLPVDYERIYPEFKNAQSGQLFSFVINETTDDVSKDNVHGVVDIIANIYDHIGGMEWEVIPYRIEWWIVDSRGNMVVSPTLAVEFTCDDPDDSTVNVIYKEGGIWDSTCNFTESDFFFIITNTDGDGIIEESDKNNALCTYSLRNGDYTLYVHAYDYAGNGTEEHMSFTINNPLRENIFDIVQVLDCSGSMCDYVSASSTDQKIEVLRYAADLFVNMMTPDIGNQFGIVPFNDRLIHITDPDPSLKELQSGLSGNVDDFTEIISMLRAIDDTSIGIGLLEAHSQLIDASDSDSAQNILLISDGDENREPFIRDVAPDLIRDDITVHALGLGYSTGIYEEKLAKLADDTGGIFSITNDDLVFRRFFLDILAIAADWCKIVDPIQYATLDPFYLDIPVGTSDSKVIIVAYWEGINADNGLVLNLITPSGKKITPDTHYPGIKYVNHPRYAFYQINFPLTGDLAEEYNGIWHTETYKRPDAGSVRYSIEAYSAGSIQLDLSSPQLVYQTGDVMQLTVNLNNNGIPVNGSKITVYGEIPKYHLPNMIYNEQIDNKILDEKVNINGDPVSFIEQKINILEEKYGDKIYEHQDIKFELYDDGQHGDKKPDDGIYGGSFRNTTIPGVYSFRIVAENIWDDQSFVTRELTRCFYNRVNIKPEFSIIDLDPYYDKLKRQCYGINVIPKDEFGNMLGSGYEMGVTIKSDGKKRDLILNDEIDGTYQGNITLTEEETKYGAQLILTIEGKYFVIIEILPKP